MRNNEAQMMLQCHDIVAGYGETNILNGLSLDVRAGEIVAIIGPNGAGKSTLLKALAGVLRPRGGRVVLTCDDAGVECAGWKAHQVSRRGLGYVPQLQNVFPGMTVRENLELGSYADWQARDENIEAALALFPMLRARLRTRAGSLSGGERTLLAIARALVSKPNVLLLDEPSAGVAPRFVEVVFDKMREIAEGGVPILLVEQNARRSLEAADYCYVLDQGTNRLEGLARDLLEDPRVSSLYLGGGIDDEDVVHPETVERTRLAEGTQDAR